MQRRVVLICGPPGAGKSTYAHTLNLEVFDVDDPQWSGEKEFREALSRLAKNPNALAVVIRSGATREARRKAVTMCGATEITVLATDPSTCVNRIIERGRDQYHREAAAVTDWWNRYEPDIGTSAGFTATQSQRPKPRRRQRSTTQRDKDRTTIRRGNPACALCGEPIDYTLPHLDPGEYVVDHIIPLHRGGLDRLHNKQPAHRACNAAKAGRLTAPIVRRSGTLT